MMGSVGVLIFGTSHVGKSTLAARIGEATGWSVLSSDKMARHPGRPWPTAHAPVAEFYDRLTDATIYWFLQRHRENMWPLIGGIIDAERHAGKGFVLEGSALRPDYLATLNGDGLVMIGLHATRDFLEARMRAQSRYSEQDAPTRNIFDKFIERSLRDNDAVRENAERHKMRLIDVADVEALDAIFDEVVTMARSRI